jgi:hypothetical protein
VPATALAVFTRDLRVHDNPMLVRAAESAEWVVPAELAVGSPAPAPTPAQPGAQPARSVEDQRLVPICPRLGGSEATTVAHGKHRIPEGMSVNAKPAAGMVCEHRASAHPRPDALLA